MGADSVAETSLLSEMGLKVVCLVLVLGASAWASISTKPGFPVHRLYNENMKSMLMPNEAGHLVKVNLVKPDKVASRSLRLPTKVSENIHYFLFTPEQNSVYEIYSNNSDVLKNSTFNPSRPTKVLIHGFTGNFLSDSEQLIRKAYLTAENVNVISVEWGKLCEMPDYVIAVENVWEVGKEVGRLIDFLVQNGANLTSIHLIGHSLGAHVAGFAGKAVTSGKVTRITALDPALPVYSKFPANYRLNNTDAATVDCIHSCSDYLGFHDPICTHDFYPNKGEHPQPGCPQTIAGGACSHSRSYLLFVSSVHNATAFPARSCTSMAEVEAGSCTGNNTAYMGVQATQGLPGIYYLTTTGTPPYY